MMEPSSEDSFNVVAPPLRAARPSLPLAEADPVSEPPDAPPDEGPVLGPDLFKYARQPSGLMPAAEQLSSSSTAVAAEQTDEHTDEQTDGTTEDAKQGPVLGPKGRLSSSCVCVHAFVRVCAWFPGVVGAGRFLSGAFVLSRPAVADRTEQ